MEAPLFSLEQIHMGGTFSIKAYPQPHLSYTETCELALAAFDEVRRIENLLTDFRPSPFNAINNSAGVSPVLIPPEIIALIEKSFEFSRLTNGAFDISYASVGQLWRLARATGVTPSLLDLEQYKSYVDYRKIQIDHKNQTVFLPEKKMRIGLAGIGKGYAVDCAFDLLKKAGLINFQVSGAGDLRTHCAPDAPRAWRVGIRNPLSSDPNKQMGILQLRNNAVATSGDYVNFVPGTKDHSLHHIIDPQTGNPSTGLACVTIMAEQVLTADVLATAAMVMGKDQALTLLNRQSSIAFLVTKSGAVHFTERAACQMKRDQEKLSEHHHENPLSTSLPFLRSWRSGGQQSQF
jgi:thiamine biosynthesis lipoprotein